MEYEYARYDQWSKCNLRQRKSLHRVVTVGTYVICKFRKLGQRRSICHSATYKMRNIGLANVGFNAVAGSKTITYISLQ